MKSFSLLFISILISLSCWAKSTVVQGSINGFNGEKIRLAFYEDYISFKKVHVGEATIENNQFRLDFNLNQTRQLVIIVQDKQTSIFAEAGQVYNLSLSYNDSTNSARAFEKYLDLKFSFPKSDELNQRIKQFNADYQDFFSKNYQKFVVKEADHELEKFIHEQESKSIYEQPEYLKSYVEYALANLKDINHQPKDELYANYLKDRKVRVDHKEYMNFFSQFYAEDFEQLLITKSAVELMKALMLEKDPVKSLQLTQKLKGFDQQELTELYLINGLFEVFHKKTIDQNANLMMLNYLAKNASNNKLKLAAKNVSSKLKISSNDSQAPSFSLKNTQGEIIHLKDLKGKPIYLGFWANWSVLSLKELKLIERLNEEYGDQVHFVSINIDEKEEIFRSVKEQNNYSWSFLYAGNQYQMREDYEVKTAPIYYLLDNEGKIIQKFAPGPQYIERDLKKLIAEGS